MRTLQEDIDYALVRRHADVFSFLYSRTNEDLELLFNNTDVMNKRVFSVLSSSDYLFSAIDAGASVVDTFDINPLTYRYYHLRKWLLQHGYVDAAKLSYDDLFGIIYYHDLAISKDEEESEVFWKKYLELFPDEKLYYSPLFVNVFAPKVNYQMKKRKLVQKLSARELDFRPLDICSEEIELDKKYDLAFISNILDYNRDKSKLVVARDNLGRILNNGGRVILSRFRSRHSDEGINLEERIFASDFYILPLDVPTTNGYNYVSYRQYIKR